MQSLGYCDSCVAVVDAPKMPELVAAAPVEGYYKEVDHDGM